MKDKENRKAALQEAFRRVHERVRSSLVLLGRDRTSPTKSDLRGSGILVQMEDGRKGVLTAAHCIEPEEESTVILVGQASQRGRVVPYRVPNAHVVRHLEGRQEDCPDLAFIALSAEEASKMEAQSTVFHRVGRQRPPAEKAEAGEGRAVWTSLVASGWPGVLNEVMGPKAVGYVLESVMDVPVEEIHEKNGWDYADHVFEDRESIKARAIESIRLRGMGDPPEAAMGFDLTGESRGGYSGGGIWRVWWIDGEDNYKLDLEGIMFLQWGENKGGQRKLRAHQAKSIARILGIEPWDYWPLRGAKHEPGSKAE